MTLTYQTEGIILKTMAIGEADRLVTILSPEKGLIKAIAPGARKPRSKLGGRTTLFVVNQMMCLKGRSLDKLLQADSKESFPGLSKNLAKLTTAQYWAELVLLQSLSDHADPQLYELQLQLLKDLEQCATDDILFLLLEGISQFLFIAGITPELQQCCQSQKPIHPALLTSGKGIYFSFADGGTVIGDTMHGRAIENQRLQATKTDYTKTNNSFYQGKSSVGDSIPRTRHHRLTYPQWIILNAITPKQNSSRPLEQNPKDLGMRAWLSVEKILRGYVQHHFDRSIRSAALVESVFSPSNHP